jgi:hypothetical protein
VYRRPLAANNTATLRRVSDGTSIERCPSCGLRRAAISGAVDPYGASTPSCWAAFNEVLVRDFSAWQPLRHRLTVDAYMAQHPSFATPSGRRSVLTHLVGLHAALELQLAPKVIGRLLGAAFPDKSDRAVPALEPIPDLTAITVAHLSSAVCADDHDRLNREWAASVWQAWHRHHSAVRALAEQASRRAPRDR